MKSCERNGTTMGGAAGRGAVRRSVAARRGISSLEMVAALAVITIVLGSTMPLFVRHLRLLADSRHERLALEELANLAERLRAVPPAEVAGFIASPPLSDRVVARLPGARATATRDPGGARVVLHLSWESPGRIARPQTLAVWLPPPPTQDGVTP